MFSTTSSKICNAHDSTWCWLEWIISEVNQQKEGEKVWGGSRQETKQTASGALVHVWSFLIRSLSFPVSLSPSSPLAKLIFFDCAKISEKWMKFAINCMWYGNLNCVHAAACKRNMLRLIKLMGSPRQPFIFSVCDMND